MVTKNEDEQVAIAGRNLTFIYSEFIVRFRLISEMIKNTKSNWERY